MEIISGFRLVYNRADPKRFCDAFAGTSAKQADSQMRNNRNIAFGFVGVLGIDKGQDEPFS